MRYTLFVLFILACIILSALGVRARKREELPAFVYDTVLVSMAVAFLTSAIFYYFSVYIPKKHDTDRINVFAKAQCGYLISDCSNLVSFLAFQAGSSSLYPTLSSNEFFEIAAKVNPHDAAPISLVEGGKGHTRDYIAHMRRESRKVLDALSPYSYALESELVMYTIQLVDNAYFSDRFVNGVFFQNLQMFGGNKDLSIAAPALWNYIQTTKSIEQYWKDKKVGQPRICQKMND